MSELAFRTRRTALSDDQLILMDVLFKAGTWPYLLRRQHFLPQWFLGYSHELTDAELVRTLQRMCDEGLLTKDDEDGTVHMTPEGGRLWSLERLPVWDRFCVGRHADLPGDRVRVSVLALSPAIRDHFLELWPDQHARCKSAVIRDRPLIPWMKFEPIHVGIAVWKGFGELTIERWDESQRRQQRCRSERSWWTGVPELQKFVGN